MAAGARDSGQPRAAGPQEKGNEARRLDPPVVLPERRDGRRAGRRYRRKTARAKARGSSHKSVIRSLTVAARPGSPPPRGPAALGWPSAGCASHLVTFSLFHFLGACGKGFPQEWGCEIGSSHQRSDRLETVQGPLCRPPNSTRRARMVRTAIPAKLRTGSPRERLHTQPVMGTPCRKRPAGPPGRPGPRRRRR